MIARSRTAMWGFQNKLNCILEIDLYFIVHSTPQMKLPEGKSLFAKIALDTKEIVFTETLQTNSERQRIEFYMNSNTIFALMVGSTYWNHCLRPGQASL